MLDELEKAALDVIESEPMWRKFSIGEMSSVVTPSRLLRLIAIARAAIAVAEDAYPVHGTYELSTQTIEDLQSEVSWLKRKAS